MYKQIKYFVTVASFALASVAANASLISINTSYDLSNGLSSTAGTLDNGTVSIANGDSVDLTVQFSNSQALTLGDGSEYFGGWLRAGDNKSSFSILNATIEFLGFSSTGGASSVYNLGATSGGAAHLGPYLSNFLSAGQDITFSGYRVTYDVTSIVQSPHNYSSLWFHAGSINSSVGPANVPEPGPLALLGLGLLGLGLARRKNPSK